MTAPVVLLVHSVKRVRTLVGAMALLLCGFQMVLTLVARSLYNSGGFAQLGAMLPPFVREMMGPALAGFMSFAGIVCLGYFHLAVISSLIALSITLATIPTSEIESGFIDVILARPLARHWVITRSIVLALLATGFVLAMMMLGTWLGLRTLAPQNAVWPARTLIFGLVKNLGLLMLCWNGVAMAIGSASRRRGAAGAMAGFLALGMFLLDYVGRLWKTAESVAWLSPFRYYNPFELVMGNPVPLKNLIVLTCIALAGFTISYIVFSMRDITH